MAVLSFLSFFPHLYVSFPSPLLFPFFSFLSFFFLLRVCFQRHVSFFFFFLFLSLYLRVALPPTPSFLFLLSNQKSVRAGYRELCSTCISLWIVSFIFLNLCEWLAVFEFAVTYLLPNCYLSWSCSASLHAGIACESKLT